MNPHKVQYPVVDLFAGTGGFAEGFARISGSSPSVFNVVASIERDPHAYQTLLLRHFFWLFHPEGVPEDYYKYLAKKITKEELIRKNKKQWEKAKASALQVSMGKETRDSIKSLISQRLCGKKKWVLIGGPPCQSYSLVGRSRMMRCPSFEEDERHFLYREYRQIILDHRPPVFVMENVKGLLSARVNGKLMIDEIVRDLSNPGRDLKYRLFSLSSSEEIKEDIGSFLVKAEKYGVPQARHRMFILGVRDDIDVVPSILQKKNSPTVEQILSSMPKIRSGVSRQKDSDDLWKEIITSASCADWFPVANGSEKIIKKTILSAIREVRSSDLQRSSSLYRAPRAMRPWYYDERLTAMASHEARSHMETDLHLYLFVSSHGLALDVSPKLADFPVDLLPAHKNVKDGCKGKMFSDRFRVQIKSRVSTTVTSHISKDGHYFIHYDPSQCRSLTVREAARLQTFPDNYFFEGPRTAQYHQVGNAAPPYLTMQIAKIVKEILDTTPGN